MSEFWPVVAGAVALVAWHVRLEAKVTYLTKSLEDVKGSIKEDQNKIWSKIDIMQSQLVAILQSTANIEGHLAIGKNKNK